MKKLPKIYKNDINKSIRNNKEVCYLRSEENPDLDNNYSVKEILDEIFNGIGYSYNIPVIIETSNKIYDTSLITRTKSSVATLDNEVIALEEINKITIKNYK